MDKCVNKTRITYVCCGVFLGIFGVVPSAIANNTPEANVFFAEIAILPLMIGCSLLGGFYVLVVQKTGKRPRLVGKLVGAIALILWSGINEGAAMLVVFIFGGIALGRGVHMLYWGIRGWWKHQHPMYLQKASPWRLIPSGIALIPLTLFFMGMSIAFQTYIGGASWQEKARIERLQRFIAYQIAYTQLAKQTKGKYEFHHLSSEHPYPKRFQSDFSYGHFFRITLESDNEHGNFVVYLLPMLPFSPYNYFTSAPSYRGDQSGMIHMIRVQHHTQQCPETAPIVMEVTEDDIEEMKRIIRAEISKHD